MGWFCLCAFVFSCHANKTKTLVAEVGVLDPEPGDIVDSGAKDTSAEIYDDLGIDRVDSAQEKICAETLSCDDGNPCTLDECDEKLGCTHEPEWGPCEDGDPCTEDDFCADGLCNSGNWVPCDPAGECSEVSCPKTCNGAVEYCDRPYNQVSVVCTHNAYATLDEGFIVPAPNQKYGFTKQLDDGVRCLMLDIHSWLGKLYLCHGVCEAGRTNLNTALVEIADWMALNPNEIITFIVESHVGEKDLLSALVDSGLAAPGGVADEKSLVYQHTKTPGSPWPTLASMIEAGQRVVVFSDDEDAEAAWHLNWLKYGWETPYNDSSFGCSPGRGNPEAYDNQVFILNHYTLCAQGGCTSKAEVNNAYDFVLQRALECWEHHETNNPWKQIPTFINVDNYHVPSDAKNNEIADVFEAVSTLNSLWPTPENWTP